MHNVLNFDTLRMMLPGLAWQQKSKQWDRGNCMLIGDLFTNCQRSDRQKCRSLDLQTEPEPRCSPVTTIAPCKQSGTRRLIYTAVIAGAHICLWTNAGCVCQLTCHSSWFDRRQICCACSSVDVGRPSVDLLVACGPQQYHSTCAIMDINSDRIRNSCQLARAVTTL